MFFEIFRYGSWVCLGFIVYQHPLFIDVNLYCMLYCMSVFYHSQRGHIVFLPRVVFLFSRLIMGKTRHCAGCKTPLSEKTFKKQGKSCSGPEPFPDVSVVEEGTAFPSQPLEDEPQETIEATLASLLGAVKSLTTGLKEVKADNQQLRALLTNQSLLKEVPVPSMSTGGVTASGVTLPELRAMQDLSQQADRRVAQLGLADSSASDSDHDEVEPPAHVRAKDISASNGGGKSLKSGKESKITTTVLYPQLWPHSFLSLTNARRDIKYDDLTLEEFVAGYGQILQSPDITEMERSARPKHLVSLMYFAQQYEWQAVLSFHGAGD